MLLEYTMEELMIEYLKDAIEMDPGEAFPTQTLEDGVQFTRTGDEVVDAWEKDIAKGSTPDFGKAFKNEADRKVFEAWLKPKKRKTSNVSQSAVVMPVVADLTQAECDARADEERNNGPHPEELPDDDEELPDWFKETITSDGFNDDYSKEK